MSRFKLAVMLTTALSAAGCGNSTTSPTATPTTTSVTDTFSGTLNRNGASSFAFSVSAAGTVYATLTSVADASTNVGLSLGAWNGTACSIILSNDAAVQGTTVAGAVTGIGTLCARVYDVGKVVDPLDYQITVVHP
jgi:hypothetical protein